MGDTTISWANKSWNPIFGCSKVSDGCRHCYAERVALRNGMSWRPWTVANVSENIVLREDRLGEPAAWKQPARIFVCSMSDLFHLYVPDEYIRRVFQVMESLPRHTFIVLTKRIERAAKWSRRWASNIWIGTSVEDDRVTYRMDALRTIPAAIRFVSFEPLIGPVGTLNLKGIHWAIVGGESGPTFRPMDHAWARDIRDQCAKASTVFFFKQSAGYKSETGIELIEADGTARQWREWPSEPLRPPPQEPPTQMGLFS